MSTQGPAAGRPGGAHSSPAQPAGRPGLRGHHIRVLTTQRRSRAALEPGMQHAPLSSAVDAMQAGEIDYNDAVLTLRLVLAKTEAKGLQPKHMMWPCVAGAIALLADMAPLALKARARCGYSHRELYWSVEQVHGRPRARVQALSCAARVHRLAGAGHACLELVRMTQLCWQHLSLMLKLMSSTAGDDGVQQRQDDRPPLCAVPAMRCGQAWQVRRCQCRLVLPAPPVPAGHPWRAARRQALCSARQWCGSRESPLPIHCVF